MLYDSKLVIERVKQLHDYTSKNKPMANWGYWICGVRSEADDPDKFDDTFYLFKGEEFIMDTTGTTNPGVKILKGGFRKYNKDGAAVLESDRIYWNVWKYGKHLGWMPALKQLGNSVTIWRDGNGNDKSEEIGKRTTGWYGINFHTATKSYMMDIIKNLIGGWSAGCMVANNTKDYRKIIEYCKTQDKTTFVLLKEFSV